MNIFKLVKFTVEFGFKNTKAYRNLTVDFKQSDFDKIVYNYCIGALDSLGITYEILDLRAKKTTENVQYISNHNSMYDSLITAVAVKNRHSYFIADEFSFLLKVPIVGNLMRFMHSIFVDRSNLRAGIKSIKQGVQNLKEGLNLVIFAEGEISKYVLKPGQKYIGDFHAGSFKPALITKKKIVPITIVGSDKIHNSRSLFTRVNKGHVKVIIGEAIDVHLNESLTAVELAEITRNQILDTYQANL